ncbi:Kynurenine formamidase [Paenibacillus catalpae]|uniref:Kynurenine formamidase n=1 Tax=Paenibacillus catalpae TaxID=1045775 RepID=A0A1I2A5X1_9BACL|nr:cyclase family protein [Paenibacillus catalpae]SFE39534.1 Kynurenine formamidase [Paenibacillus catalpae]
MFKVYDISMTIEEGMQVWGNHEGKQPHINSQPTSPDGVNESRIDMDVHCGTHVDAPLHMLEDGETIETLGLEELVGNARVLDFTEVKDSITREDLEKQGLQKGEFILVKTSNSYTDTFASDFVFLREDGARYLVEVGVRGIGTDGLGIERSQPEYPTHRTLFRNNVIIVEGLRLKEVPPGSYFMVIAPLKLTGIEAAPARALLIGNG